jgi:hypothetical protein
MINLLNIYGHCQHRKDFWNKVELHGLLDLQNLIIAGDLNFTTNLSEVWGDSVAKDPLADYFTDLFLSHDIIDLQPDILAPSWHNGHVGPTYISKRLDRFYLSEVLLALDNRIRTWVDTPFVSDHAPTYLQFGSSTIRIHSPFKLNSCWILEDGFNAIVFAVWNDRKFQSELRIQQRISWKLKQLKLKIKIWASHHRRLAAHRLHVLEDSIKDLQHIELLDGPDGYRQ